MARVYLEGKLGKVSFQVFCPTCKRNLFGESIIEISTPDVKGRVTMLPYQKTFFYTSQGHQLSYSGLMLNGVYCAP
jgi:hypothetical protein